MNRFVALIIPVVSLFLFFGITSADAAELRGTWHGQGSNSGQWYAGTWKLTGTGNNRTMYFNGRNSACNSEAIPMRFRLNGNTFTLSGNGCGTSHHATGKVGDSRIHFAANKFGKPWVSNVRGW